MKKKIGSPNKIKEKRLTPVKISCNIKYFKLKRLLSDKIQIQVNKVDKNKHNHKEINLILPHKSNKIIIRNKKNKIYI